MRRLRSVATERPALAVAIALVLVLIGAVVLAAIVTQSDGPGDRPVTGGQADRYGQTAARDAGRDRGRGGDSLERPARDSGGPGRRDERTNAGAVRPERPDSRVSLPRARGKKTMVPDHLLGQRGEVSREDLRLSGLRGRIAGPEDAAVCAVRPAQSSLVAKGSTVVLKTRC
jgi:hypothetical protein